jgi:hypothetical protein
MISRMQVAGTGLQSGPTMTPAPPRTRGLTVLGWMFVCFSVIPLAMGATGDGAWIGWSGAAMLTIGVAMVVIGKRPRDVEPR